LTESAIYEGWVRHRRMSPVEHSFRYRFFLAYLDLGELPEVLDPYPLYSARRRAPARFRRSDYLGDPARPLDECVRDVVEASGAPRPAGPMSFYYCFDPTGRRVEDVVAEVENIPWGERHAYVLDRGAREGTVLADELEKKHHVSPLMGMDQTYTFRAGTPGERLQVHIESRPAEEVDPLDRVVDTPTPPKTFDATLSLRRRELSTPLLLGLLARYPAMSLQVAAKIYVQAARLKLKGARYYPHPGEAEVAR
jgi:uncharacterized protein